MKHIHFAPTLLGLLCGTTILITYIWSARISKRFPGYFLPTISETGDARPESCIFTWGVSNSAFLLLLIILTKYSQNSNEIATEEQFLRTKGGEKLSYWRKLNRANTVLGAIACFCLNNVASFQSSVVPLAHYISAVIFYFFILIYCGIQTRLSFKFRDFETIESKESNFILYFRVAIVVASVIFWFGGIGITITWSIVGNTDYYWSWVAVMEWSLSASFLIYVISYSMSFRHSNVHFIVSKQIRYGTVPQENSETISSFRHLVSATESDGLLN